MLRKNLRKFEGFEFAADSDEQKKRMKATQQVDIAKLKTICEGLDIKIEGEINLILLRKYQLSIYICLLL